MDKSVWTIPERIAPFVLAALSLMFGVSFIHLQFIQWDLADEVGPFLHGPLLGIMRLILIALIIGSLIFLAIRSAMRFKGHLIIALLPLIINLGTLAMTCFFPFTDVWLDTRFSTYRADFEQVVSLVEAGEIEPDEGGSALLPTEYQHLSKGGGEIEIDQSDGVTRVLFYTYCGVLDNFSGFIYHSDDQPPGEHEFGGDWQQVEQIAPHWYFAASY